MITTMARRRLREKRGGEGRGAVAQKDGRVFARSSGAIPQHARSRSAKTKKIYIYICARRASQVSAASDRWRDLRMTPGSTRRPQRPTTTTTKPRRPSVSVSRPYRTDDRCRRPRRRRRRRLHSVASCRSTDRSRAVPPRRPFRDRPPVVRSRRAPQPPQPSRVHPGPGAANTPRRHVSADRPRLARGRASSRRDGRGAAAGPPRRRRSPSHVRMRSK